MSLSTRDENLVQYIPNLKRRVDTLEEIGNLQQVTIYDALNESGGTVLANTPINLRDNAGFLVFIKASNRNGIECNAFALETINNNEVGKVIIDGVIIASGFIPGKKYFLGDGVIANSIEIGSGYLSQVIGRAYSPTVLEIDIRQVIRLR